MSCKRVFASPIKGVLTGVLALSAVFLCAPSSLAAPATGAPGAAGRPVTVTSDTMEAVTGENLVIFKGNVMAVEDFTLCSDELRIRYGQDKGVDSIEADGNVRIFQDNKVSTSAMAVYDRKGRTLVLTGHPQVRQCTDIIKGDRITVYLDQDNAVVEGGEGGRVRALIMPDKACGGGADGGKGASEEALCKGSR
ncbi:MAG: LptA/OstA family protein [Thermodesulfobacteriota bacterium]